jgi:hypothetical protein
MMTALDVTHVLGPTMVYVYIPAKESIINAINTRNNNHSNNIDTDTKSSSSSSSVPSVPLPSSKLVLNIGDYHSNALHVQICHVPPIETNETNVNVSSTSLYNKQYRYVRNRRMEASLSYASHEWCSELRYDHDHGDDKNNSADKGSGSDAKHQFVTTPIPVPVYIPLHLVTCVVSGPYPSSSSSSSLSSSPPSCHHLFYSACDMHEDRIYVIPWHTHRYTRAGTYRVRIRVTIAPATPTNKRYEANKDHIISDDTDDGQNDLYDDPHRWQNAQYSWIHPSANIDYQFTFDVIDTSPAVPTAPAAASSASSSSLPSSPLGWSLINILNQYCKHVYIHVYH